MNTTAQAPKVSDMKMGTVIVNQYGEFKVTGTATHDGETWWEVSNGRGCTVVGEHSLQFYTLKP